MKVGNALSVEPTNRWIRHSAVVLVQMCNFNVWQQYIKDREESFHTTDFYKAFGQPQRKQLISGDGVFNPDHYYFYYECKDGTVQIEINATSLSNKNLVLVSGLNIL